ncbi:hypothetical protein [Arthrobacter sp. GMC3]|uniref:hypothetical protein n=1 Tax=Arthrobacter sp. GMC3 TaxID=2058894 RepID=UPI0011B00358|nr:hypothetical protein [Arthrobacter sp. GMC3]
MNWLIMLVPIAVFFVLFRRYLTKIYSPSGRLNNTAFRAARSAGLLPAALTCLALVAAVLATTALAPLSELGPWIIGTTAFCGMCWALLRMTRAAGAHQTKGLDDHTIAD